MVGHACPGPLGCEGAGFRSIRYEQSGDSPHWPCAALCATWILSMKGGVAFRDEAIKRGTLIPVVGDGLRVRGYPWYTFDSPSSSIR